MVEMLLGTPPGRLVQERFRRWPMPLHAPALVDVECAHVLRRLVFLGKIASSQGERAIELLQDLRLERHAHEILLPRIWALRNTLSAYDASYVALAEALDAPLLTRDGRIAKAGHTATVEVV